MWGLHILKILARIGNQYIYQAIILVLGSIHQNLKHNTWKFWWCYHESRGILMKDTIPQSRDIFDCLFSILSFSGYPVITSRRGNYQCQYWQHRWKSQTRCKVGACKTWASWLMVSVQFVCVQQRGRLSMLPLDKLKKKRKIAD